MDGREFAEGLLTELHKKKNRRVKVPVTWETLEELIRDVLDPKPQEKDPTPFFAPAAVFDPDKFPKLKVKYGADLNIKGLTGEKLVAALKGPRDFSATSWVVVQNEKAEEPFHSSGWLTRKMSELEQLKADGVPEFAAPRKPAGVS